MERLKSRYFSVMKFFYSWYWRDLYMNIQDFIWRQIPLSYWNSTSYSVSDSIDENGVIPSKTVTSSNLSNFSNLRNKVWWEQKKRFGTQFSPSFPTLITKFHLNQFVPRGWCSIFFIASNCTWNHKDSILKNKEILGINSMLTKIKARAVWTRGWTTVPMFVLIYNGRIFGD